MSITELDTAEIELRAMCLEDKRRIAELEVENASLRAALTEATDAYEEYAEYAGEYLCEKHGVRDDIVRLRTIAVGG